MVNTYIEFTKELVEQYNLLKVKNIVSGGKTGQLSIYNGLIAAKQISKNSNDIILIHDGVRTIISESLILSNIQSVKDKGSAISCVRQKEINVIIADENRIDSTTDRNYTWIARAPQSFYLKDILELHEICLKRNITEMIDSCSMMLYFGKQLFIVETLSDNIKITTLDDYFYAKALIEAKNSKQTFEK